MGSIIICWVAIFTLSFIECIAHQPGFSSDLVLANCFAISLFAGMDKIIKAIKDK